MSQLNFTVVAMLVMLLLALINERRHARLRSCRTCGGTRRNSRIENGDFPGILWCPRCDVAA